MKIIVATSIEPFVEVALWLLDLHGSADRLIAIAPPSYQLRHPNSQVTIRDSGWQLIYKESCRSDYYGLPLNAEVLQELAAKCGVKNRVTFLSDWISEKRKVELFADCLVAVYFPYDEDSHGYASLEAHHARKYVITTHDVGGTRELVLEYVVVGGSSS